MKITVGLLLLLMAWLQPMHIFPWLSWHSEALGFLAALAMGWGLVYVAAKRNQFVADRLDVPAAAAFMTSICAIVFLQWLAGLIQFSGDVVVFIAYFVLCVLGLSVGFSEARDNRQFASALATTIAIGAVCSAFVALAQAFEVWDTLGWIHRSQYSRRPGANIGQPNQLATLLVMGMVSVLYLYENRNLSSSVTALLAMVLCVALAAAESKSGMLSLAVLAIWWVAKRKTMTSQAPVRSVAVCGLVCLGLFWYWPLFMQEVFQYKTEITAFNHPAVMNRWIVWPQLIQAVMLKPWAGWGFGQVAVAHNAVADAFPRSEAYTYAHNILLDLALGFGLPLTIVLVAIVSGWAWRRIRAVRQLDQWYFSAVVGPVAIHSMFEYPFAYSYFLLPIMVAIGALEGKLGIQSLFRLRIKSLTVALAVMTAAFGYSLAEYLAIEEDFRVVRFQALRVGKVPENYHRPHIYVFTQLDLLLNGLRIVPRPNMSISEIETARNAALHFPMLATQNRYALSLALNGYAQEAIRQLAVIRAQQQPRTYARLKAEWVELAIHQYPSLRELRLPL